MTQPFLFTIPYSPYNCNVIWKEYEFKILLIVIALPLNQYDGYIVYT